MPSGKVRIIGGHWRGSKISVADTESLRPTPDRVRETLFNWLAPHIVGARCLDLFAGSGVLGLEALSRGAKSLTCVEKNPDLCRAIKADAKRLGAADIIKAHCADALQWVADKNNLLSDYSIVFLDPPYQSNLLQNTLDLIGDYLSPFVSIYIESDQPLNELQLPRPIIKSDRAANVHYALLHERFLKSRI